jgi:hypothetical protein
LLSNVLSSVTPIGGDRISEDFSHIVSSKAAPVGSGWSRYWMGLALLENRRLYTVQKKRRRHGNIQPIATLTKIRQTITGRYRSLGP